MNDKAATTDTTGTWRMPAEWEPHQATWLSWPHNPTTWPVPGGLAQATAVYAQMVAALARFEPVHINVNDAAMEAQARTALAAAGAAGSITFHHIPTNDAWCRDHGPIMVCDTAPGSVHKRVAIDCAFNGWGNKEPYDLDNQVAAQVAQALGVPRHTAGMVLEGGAIDVNGAGLLLTSEACLLNPNRNPHLHRAEIEQRLRALFGVQQVLWLGEGIVGDDTDGHVDDLARFVAPDTVVTVVEDDPSDANYAALQDNLARLSAMRDQAGTPLRVLTLPMPPPVIIAGERLPASYANFYIANGVVLLPCFHPPTDERARRVLAECFPTREIIGIDCTDMVLGLGTFHCLTQQIPAW